MSSSQKHKTRFLIGMAGLAAALVAALALTAASLTFTKSSDRCQAGYRLHSMAVGSEPPPSTDLHRGSGRWRGVKNA